MRRLLPLFGVWALAACASLAPMRLPDGTDAGLARTLTVAALALGVLWDPANGMLD